MSGLWFHEGFGLLMVPILFVVWINFLKEKNIFNDEKVLKIIREELYQDGFDYFELKSITSLDKPKITSVIVNVGFQEIALEIDNNSEKIISKERIARQ